MLSVCYRWSCFLSRIAGSSTWNEAGFRERNFFEGKLPGARGRREECQMSLMELLTLLAVILSLLSLIIDAVRLTVEVMEKTSQHKDDDSKKD